MNVADSPGYFFLDTSIFVYSFDNSVPEKQGLAQRLIQTALESRRAIISTQVVQEFLNVALRKFVRPMTVSEGHEYLDAVLMPLCQHYPSLTSYKQALLLKEEAGYSFYDSLIVVAAVETNCKMLFSEDMQHGHIVRGLQIVNPFN